MGNSAMGISWKLSGGSQLSSSPTKVAKKCHVLRAIRRRVRRSSSHMADSGNAPWLTDEESYGRRAETRRPENRHRRRKRSGRSAIRESTDHERRAPAPATCSRRIAISHSCSRCSADAAVSHSSSLRRVKNSRTSVRAMASTD